MMRAYDLVLVLRSSLSEAQRKKLLDSIKAWFDKEAKVVKEESWGQKALSYPIKKEIAGLYHFLQLETEKSVPKDVEKKLIDQENVLRHLLIRKKVIIRATSN